MSETAVQASIEMLLASGLIEPYDPSKKDFSSDQQIAITHSGLAHLDLGMFNPVFFEQQALTTRIVDADVAAHIRAAYRSTRSIDQRLEDVRGLFSTYLADEDGRLCTVPETSQFKNQRHLANDLVRQWNGSVSTSEQMLKISDLAAEMAAAVVERFDPEKGYGFVEIPALRDQAFLHARVLEQCGFGDVLDGDDLVCDVIRTDKGLSISVVHEVRQPPQRTYKAEIAKLFPNRRYGFMVIHELALDAFFHYHIFRSAEEAGLSEGQIFLVEIKTDAQGRSQVRRIVDSA
jgi:cold shock CspA family protein